MRIHPRLIVVQRAELALDTFMIGLVNEHDLTPAEQISLLANQIKTVSMYAIRSERHPDDPEKRGDEA